jgi:hypothetical protein
LENPTAGIVEADEMDYARCLEVQPPYLGPVIGAYTDWTPLTGRPGLFPEDIDESDPWQFKNVLVRREGAVFRRGRAISRGCGRFFRRGGGGSGASCEDG